MMVTMENCPEESLLQISLQQVESLDVGRGPDMKVSHTKRQADGCLTGSNGGDGDGHDDALPQDDAMQRSGKQEHAQGLRMAIQ